MRKKKVNYKTIIRVEDSDGETVMNFEEIGKALSQLVDIFLEIDLASKESDVSLHCKVVEDT